MNFLVDSDICSLYLKGNHRLWTKFQQHQGQIAVSVITVAEIAVWAFRKSAPPSRFAALSAMLTDVSVISVSPDVAIQFGRLRAEQHDAGQLTPVFDLLIAATAIHHQLILVTHNVADFQNIPGVQVLDWLV